MALEIRTSLRPERPGTTPKGEARSKQTTRKREKGGARALTTRTSLRLEESEAKEEGKDKQREKRKDSEARKGKGHATQEHRGSREREKRTTKEQIKQRKEGVTAKSTTGTKGGNKGTRKTGRH